MKHNLFTLSALLVFQINAAAAAPPRVCDGATPIKSMVLYEAKSKHGTEITGRVFLCSKAPIDTEALIVEAEKNLKTIEGLKDTKFLYITSVVPLKG